MKFKDYLKNLNEFVEQFPEILEYDTIYSSDSEGNYFEQVRYSPSLGYYEDGNFNTESDEPNSICIN